MRRPKAPRCSDSRQAPRRLLGSLLLGGLAVVALACSGFGSNDAALVERAEGLLRDGDLPAAAAEYQRIVAENPSSISGAVGLSYVQLLSGDIVAADTTLAEIETRAGDEVGGIRLRRALIALEARDFDRVKMLGTASGLDEGKLLAAEVYLVDLQTDQAVALLREVGAQPGVVGDTAREYLALIESADQHKASLADVSALWALGNRAEACDAVLDTLKALDDADPQKDELLLLWAGRAVASGRAGVAKNLLDGASPPPGQQWRFGATNAMILLTYRPDPGVAPAAGQVRQGLEMFKALKNDPDVPGEGLADALATACALVRDPAIAQQLVQGVDSPAVARCLAEVGGEAPASRTGDGPLQRFLENP